MLLKHISRREKQPTFVAIGALRVNIEDDQGIIYPMIYMLKVILNSQCSAKPGIFHVQFSSLNISLHWE